MTTDERDEAWRDFALCQETDPEAFFPEKGRPSREGKQVCHGCEVIAECLEYAVATKQPFGIWGGKTERERRPLLKARQASVEAAA